MPSYIMQTIVFIEEHYFEKIIAHDLANKLYVGRSTLMTNFKKYTNVTLADYITRCRLKNALILLGEGKKESEIAERCGFGDVSGFIRAFKCLFKMPPREYMKKQRVNHGSFSE